MNTIRAFRITNVFFILCGYQVHSLNSKSRDFRISVLSVIFFIAYLSWYVTGLAKYFLEKSFLLTVLQGVSPFLYNCMRVHLAIGIKAMLLILFDCKRIAKVSTHLYQIFANQTPARFTLNEFAVYFVLSLNLILLILLGIYDICMVHPKHFNLNNAVILSAVFNPHFGVVCALKLLTIGMWMMAQDLTSLYIELQLILTQSNSKGGVSILTIEEPLSIATQETSMSRQFEPCPLDRSIDLNRVVDRLKTVKLISIKLNQVVQKQLLIVVVMSALVLVESSYAFMNFDLVWKEVLFDNYLNAFFATFGCFYLFVLLDFGLLFSTSHFLSKKKKKLLYYIEAQLRSPEWSHAMFRSLKDMKETVASLGKFKIFFVFNIDWQIFILGGSQIVLCVAFITLFQYVNQRLTISSV